MTKLLVPRSLDGGMFWKKEAKIIFSNGVAGLENFKITLRYKVFLKSDKMKRNDFGYATKVWLTGILIPAIFWGLSGGILFLGLAIFYSALFSVPCCLLLWAGAWWINKKGWDVPTKKIVLCLFGVLLTVLAFLLMNVIFGDDLLEVFTGTGEMSALPFGYAASICIGIVFFDLEAGRRVLSEEPLDQIL